MAHALDETYGLENSMVYVGDLPWHRHGQQIPPNLTVEEAIEACPAVNFHTTTVPLHYSVPGVGGLNTDMDATGHVAIIRDDTNACLGVASTRYKPIQLADQWKGLNPLIKAGLASIETMGSIQGGKRVWGLVKLNASEIPEWARLEAEVGRLQPFALTMDDKTGSASALIAPTSIRVVCRNTLEAGIGGLTKCVKVRHVGDTVAKIDRAAEELWGGIVSTYERLAKRYTMLNSVKLSDNQFSELVLDNVAQFPTDPQAYASANRYKGAVQRVEAKREAVRDLWFDGKGHSGNGSAWEALNGLVEALDHNEAGAFRTPKNGGKIASMLVGTEAGIKNKVTGALVEFASERLAA